MKLSTEIFNGLLEPLFKNKRVAVIVTFLLLVYLKMLFLEFLF